MKKVLLFMALIAFGFQSRAQTWHVLLDASNTEGNATSRYYIDSSKILHWEMTAESPNAYIEDIYNPGPSPENMVQFIVWLPSPNDWAGEEIPLDAETFPYGFTGQYGGTIDLSAYTWTQITTDMSLQTTFNRISSGTPEEPYYTDYYTFGQVEL